MNVDRSALTALALFGLLGLGFAVFGLGILKNPPFPADPKPAKKEPAFDKPELMPMPRVLETARRELHVAAAAPGYSVEEIERQVAVPLEHQLMRLEGRAAVATRIEFGRCDLTVMLTKESDFHRARAELINLLNAAQANLPPGVAPVVEPRDPQALPILWLTVRSDEHLVLQMSDVLKDVVRSRLLTIPGVADVELRGESRRQVRVEISPENLLARDLSIANIADAIGKGKIALTIDAHKDLESLMVSQTNGMPILLRDVARVVDGAERFGFAHLDGKRTVLAGVHLLPDVKPHEVVRAVRDQLDAIALPPAMKLEIVADATREAAEDLSVEIEMAPGASCETVEKIVGEVTFAILKQLPPNEVTTVLTLSPKQQNGQASVRLLLSLASKRTMAVETIAKRIREAAVNFPDIRLRLLVLHASPLPQRTEFPVRLRVAGDDLDLLRKWIVEILRRAGDESAGLIDSATASQVRMPELRVVPDRAKAARVGITAADILEVYAMAAGTRSIPVRGGSVVLSFGEKLVGVDDLRKLPIRTNDGKAVTLEQVAQLEHVESLAVLERYNGQRCMTITANAAPEVSLESAKANLRKIADESRAKLKLPASYKIVDD